MMSLSVVVCSVIVVMATVSAQLMPGTVPQLPNPALKGCLNEVGYDNVTSKYKNRFANAVHRWCRVYDRALPCVDSVMSDKGGKYLKGPADWYFSMVYDTGKANMTSRSMCKKLPKVARKLPCMRPTVRRALTCVLKMTKNVKNALLRLYLNNNTDSDVAGKGACLMAAATAECFRASMTKCRRYVRNFIAGYHIIFGGKCLKSIPSVDGTSQEESVDEIQHKEETWMSKSEITSAIKVTLDPLIQQDKKTAFADAVTEKHVIKTVLSSPTMEEEERKVYGKDTSDSTDITVPTTDSYTETVTTKEVTKKTAAHAGPTVISSAPPAGESQEQEKLRKPRNRGNKTKVFSVATYIVPLLIAMFLR